MTGIFLNQSSDYQPRFIITWLWNKCMISNEVTTHMKQEKSQKGKTLMTLAQSVVSETHQELSWLSHGAVSVATSFPVASPSCPLEQERETLENAGHMFRRIREMTKHNIEGGAGKSGVMVRICQPLPLCYILSSPRFWETPDQCFPGSLSLSLLLQGTGRRGSLSVGKWNIKPVD